MDDSRKPLFIGLLLVGFIAFSGCAKKGSTIGRQKPREEPQLAADLSERVRQIQDKVNVLESDAAKLPGGGHNPREADAAHRKLMHQVFTDLTQLLPLIH